MTYIEKEYIKEWIYVYVGSFPSGSVLEKLPAMQELQEMWVQSLGQEDPLEEGMAINPVFLPREPHGWRNLVGCSPWDHKELDVTG